jgi:hypothetical protein
MSDSWHSYPKVFALGHRCIADLLKDPVLVQEKVDGSQINFGRFNGELHIKSKGAIIHVDAPDKMFARGVEVIKGLDLIDGWTYRAEYLQKPKHNVLAYDRTPINHLILFDINSGHEFYVPYESVQSEAQRLGLEVVPRLFEGIIASPEQVVEFLNRVSILGGQPVEGVVIKNYLRFGLDGHALMGKFVSEGFKEVHAGEWKAANPSKGDILDNFVAQYKTPARWQKAVQHIRERGELQGAPQDIGKLIKEAQADLATECKDEIAAKLLEWALPKIQRGIVGGLAEWYKEQLLAQQFAPEQTENTPELSEV